MPGFSAVPKGNSLTIYGSRGTIADIMSNLWETNSFAGDLDRYQIKTVIWDYFEVLKPEGEDMEVIPLPASHYFDRPYVQPAIYALRSGDKWVLIANDTGKFPEATWKFLEEKKFPFDIVICDCTYGTRTNDYGHLGGEAILDIKDRLEKIGSITKESKFVVNHFTHNAQSNHEDLQNYFNPHGIFVGYDGMEL
jgi:phosphoribosyl 1,2-cyclic phosphate phosphodiesterase